MPEIIKNDSDLPLPIRFGWGIGTLTVSLMFQATGLLLLRYLIDYVGVAATMAGLLIGGAKIYDAITDPLMGTISDRTNTRWGKRRPYIIVGTLLCAGSFILLFNLSSFQDSSAIITITFLALILNTTGYTIFNVPYLAMPAEMTSNTKVRTSLMSFRVAAVAGGQLGGSFLGPILLVYFGGGALGHSGMANTLAAVMVVAGFYCFWMTRNAPYVSSLTKDSVSPSFFEQFKTAFKVRPFAILLGVKLTQLTGFAIFMGVLPFIFTRIIGASDTYLGFYFLVQGSVLLVTQPAWVYTIRKIGKKNSYYLGGLLWGLGDLSWLWAVEGEPMIGIIVRAVMLGVGAGGLILVGQSMLPDTMQYDYQKTGIRREGIFAGVFTTVEKISFAIGPALLGLMLGSAGYLPEPNAIQPESARMVMYLSVGGLPVITLFISCLLMIFYKLDTTKLKQ